MSDKWHVTRFAFIKKEEIN